MIIASAVGSGGLLQDGGFGFLLVGDLDDKTRWSFSLQWLVKAKNWGLLLRRLMISFRFTECCFVGEKDKYSWIYFCSAYFFRTC